MDRREFVKLAGLGGVLEGRGWAKPLEAARVVATPFV